jgi:TusA-related sulfurtransferase
VSDAREETCPLNEQTVGWALHALEPDEEMEVLQHLPQCPSCQDSVRDVEQVMAGLGAAVEQVDPPPSVSSALMERLAQTPQHPRSQEARPTPDTDRVPPPSASVPARRRRRRPTGPGCCDADAKSSQHRSCWSPC